MSTQKPTITPELRRAVITTLVAETHLAYVKPIVAEYESRTLAQNDFPVSSPYSDEPKFVRDPELAYRMSNADLDRYLALTFAERDKHFKGYKGSEVCPKLHAEWQLTQARNLMLEAAQYLLPFPVEYARNSADPDIYQQTCELVIQLVVNCDPTITPEAALAQFGLTAPEPANG